MKLKQKILTIAIVPLLISVAIIGYNIIQMKSLNSSTQEIVELLVDVEALTGNIKSVQKSLSAYSTNISGSNVNEARKDLELTLGSFQAVSQSLAGETEKQLQSRIALKLDELKNKAPAALDAGMAAEAKRQALRTKGIINDVYELKQTIHQHYQQMQVDLEKRIAGLITISIVAVIGLLVGSVLFAMYFTNQIVAPIRRITEQAERIGNGDLTVERIVVKSRDEVYSLNASFEKMTNNLRELIKQVSASSSKVAASSEDLSASATETARASEQVSRSIQEVAAAGETTVARTEESTRAMEEMSLGIQSIAETSSIVAGLSQTSLEEANQGNESLQKAIHQMNSINESVDQSAKVVKLLGERSKEIEQIISVITGIANQTNLLALNAAIEAARAGEQGRGFSVVAAEVRKLAEQSSQSAQQITELIQEIKSQTDQAVSSMVKGTEDVKVGITLVDDTGHVFSRIVKAAQEVAVQIEEVSATAEQLAAGSEQVSASMTEMTSIAVESSAEAHSVATAAQLQLTTVREISESAVSLTKVADELQEMIDTFKV